MSRLALCDQPGHVVVLKIPMDESGVHDGSPVLTVAAYLERPPQWRDWTKEWNKAKRPINVFHATDCANLKGEFKGWKEEDRDPVVIRLLDVIDAANLSGVLIGIHMGEFEKAMKGRDNLRAIFGEPYVACFHWVVQTIINAAIDAGNTERLAFVHECNDYKHQALEAFGWIKANSNPGKRVIGLQFAGKEDFVPLQAADILAYEGNKRLREPSRPERRPWQRINPDGRILAAHYGRDNMHELIDRLEKIRDGRLSEIDLGSGWNRSHFRPDRDVI